ncbi:MAG: hypothetical protein GXP26_12210 [Planctomycetes bacterium]|nr:hypothetical protein [Planctomycetota bacterium]
MRVLPYMRGQAQFTQPEKTTLNSGGACWSVNPELLGATVWLAQQWNPGTRFALLDKPDSGTHRC